MEATGERGRRIGSTSRTQRTALGHRTKGKGGGDAMMKKRQEKVDLLSAEQSARRQTIAPLSHKATAAGILFHRRRMSLSLFAQNRHCFFNEEGVF